ncbi:MAG: hypothetical protein V1494_07535 [Candidatus Diapherotrites archaeon]
MKGKISLILGLLFVVAFSGCTAPNSEPNTMPNAFMGNNVSETKKNCQQIIFNPEIEYDNLTVADDKTAIYNYADKNWGLPGYYLMSKEFFYVNYLPLKRQASLV